ncbi:MAG TPA: DUF87 domain-containing protein, partial [Longimicrobiaceae bacterium]|nr:DUF87 domain-containing protein [Longimicrobiaceae bacterium]
MSAAPELAFTPDRGDVHVDLDRLVAGRLLIVADSGGGKTRAIRSFAEQTHGRVQQFLVDTEGDFGTLRERFDYLFVSAGGEGDLPAIPEQAGALCVRLLELQVSAIFDLYDLDVEERQRYTRLLLEPLTGRALPRSLWRPLAVVIDELKDLAPEGGFGESEATKAVVDLNTKGRKRAFFLVGATQRISSVDKNAISGIANKLIGLTTLDTDYARAGRMLGFQPRRYRELMELSPGEFFATGPAMSARGVTRVRTGDVLTTHIEPGRVAPPTPPAPEHIRALLEQL